MTRKDYEAIAQAFGEALAKTSAEYGGYIVKDAILVGVWNAVDAFCRVAEADNPNFNEDKFRSAVVAHRDGSDIRGIVLTGQ